MQAVWQTRDMKSVTRMKHCLSVCNGRCIIGLVHRAHLSRAEKGMKVFLASDALVVHQNLTCAELFSHDFIPHREVTTRVSRVANKISKMPKRSRSDVWARLEKAADVVGTYGKVRSWRDCCAFTPTWP